MSRHFLPARLRMRNGTVREKSADEKRVAKPFLKVKPESHIDYAKGYAVLWRITTLLLMVCANSVLQHLVRS